MALDRGRSAPSLPYATGFWSICRLLSPSVFTAEIWALRGVAFLVESPALEEDTVLITGLYGEYGARASRPICGLTMSKSAFSELSVVITIVSEKKSVNKRRYPEFGV